MRLLTADTVKLGFIGLGNMGNRIAQRLIDHRYQLFVYDRDIAKADSIAAQAVSLRRIFSNWQAVSMCFSPA